MCATPRAFRLLEKMQHLALDIGIIRVYIALMIKMLQHTRLQGTNTLGGLDTTGGARMVAQGASL